MLLPLAPGSSESRSSKQGFWKIEKDSSCSICLCLRDEVRRGGSGSMRGHSRREDWAAGSNALLKDSRKDDLLGRREDRGDDHSDEESLWCRWNDKVRLIALNCE